MSMEWQEMARQVLTLLQASQSVSQQNTIERLVRWAAYHYDLDCEDGFDPWEFCKQAGVIFPEPRADDRI